MLSLHSVCSESRWVYLPAAASFFDLSYPSLLLILAASVRFCVTSKTPARGFKTALCYHIYFEILPLKKIPQSHSRPLERISQPSLTNFPSRPQNVYSQQPQIALWSTNLAIRLRPRCPRPRQLRWRASRLVAQHQWRPSSRR